MVRYRKGWVGGRSNIIPDRYQYCDWLMQLGLEARPTLKQASHQVSYGMDAKCVRFNKIRCQIFERSLKTRLTTLLAVLYHIEVDLGVFGAIALFYLVFLLCSLSRCDCCCAIVLGVDGRCRIQHVRLPCTSPADRAYDRQVVSTKKR